MSEKDRNVEINSETIEKQIINIARMGKIESQNEEKYIGNIGLNPNQEESFHLIENNLKGKAFSKNCKKKDLILKSIEQKQDIYYKESFYSKNGMFAERIFENKKQRDGVVASFQVRNFVCTPSGSKIDGHSQFDKEQKNRKGYRENFLAI